MRHYSYLSMRISGNNRIFCLSSKVGHRGVWLSCHCTDCCCCCCPHSTHTHVRRIFYRCYVGIPFRNSLQNYGSHVHGIIDDENKLFNDTTTTSLHTPKRNSGSVAVSATQVKVKLVRERKIPVGRGRQHQQRKEEDQEDLDLVDS